MKNISTDPKLLRRIAAGGGFGVRTPPFQVAVAELLGRYPSVLEQITPPKFSNFPLLADITTDPSRLGAFAISKATGKCSAYRTVLLPYCKANGPLDPETIGIFTALPPECVGTKPLAEAHSSQAEYYQRLVLLAGSAGRVGSAVQESMARKGLKGAASVLFGNALSERLQDCRIANLLVRRTAAVHQLRTFGDHRRHGSRQRNCVGDHAMLLAVAMGQLVLFEVRHGGEIFTASVPCDEDWAVEKVERADNGVVSAGCHREVAALVEPLVADAVAKMKRPN